MDGQARVSVYLELKNRLKTGLDQAKQYLNKNVQDMKARLNDLKTSHIQAFKAMKDEVPGFGRAMELITNPYVLATAAVVGIGMAFATASAKADEFTQKMAKANVTAQESPEALKKTGSQLLGIAANSTTKGATTAAPDAYNVLLSSGMDKGTAMDTVKPTLDAAKAGFTDVETVARAAAATMNSSGITDATRVYDILFATLNKGNAEFKDIAQYLPKIVPGALAAGSSLEQVSGAFAYLTAQGQTSEKSTTLLENYFKTVSDTDKAKVFKKIGVDIYDANGGLNDMVKVSNQLNTALAGLTPKKRNTVMGSLGLDQESSNAFVALSQDAEKLEKSIGATTNSTGQLAEAIKYAKTPMDSWTQIGNQVEVMWIEMGLKINAVLGSIGDWLLQNADTIQIVIGVIGGAALAWGLYTLAMNGSAIVTGIWSTITGIATAGQCALNAAMDANPIGIIVVAIGALIGGLIVAYQKSERFRAVLAGLMEVAKLVSDVFVGLGKTIIGAFTLDVSMIKEGLTQSATAVKSIIDGGIKTAFDKGYDNSMKESAANAAKEAAEEAAAKAKTPATPANLLGAKPNSKVQAVLDKADKKKDKEASMSGGSQTKVITINKLSMIDGNFVSNNQEFSGMGKAEMERFLQELFQRMMINLGRSYS